MHLFILINTTILECFEDSTNLIYLKTKVKVMGGALRWRISEICPGSGDLQFKFVDLSLRKNDITRNDEDKDYHRPSL